jgi:pyruvate dehydrogenase E1 component alpha subunit
MTRAAPLELLRGMIRIRRFEERCAELYAAGAIRGFLHLGIGQEAVAVGVMDVLGPGDAVTATYREHGHALARGIPARAVMAEMFGKAEGCSRGRGGSMHLFDAAARFYGGHAIVAGGLPAATGLALAEQQRATGGLSVCFFGEGAVAEGAFHESINLAALWRLPLLMVCENNGYAMGTALARWRAQPDLCVQAAGYGVTAAAVDGMDVEAVREAGGQMAGAIRAGGGPRFLECRTYRFRAHSMFDPELYRDRGEVDAWKQRDPIDGLTRRLQDAGVDCAPAVAAIEREVTAELDDAVAFAERGTLESIADLLRDVYTPREPR